MVALSETVTLSWQLSNQQASATVGERGSDGLHALTPSRSRTQGSSLDSSEESRGRCVAPLTALDHHATHATSPAAHVPVTDARLCERDAMASMAARCLEVTSVVGFGCRTDENIRRDTHTLRLAVGLRNLGRM